MAEKEDKTEFTISDTYQGGYSSLDPKKASNFVGYRIPAGSISTSTDARTANVLKEVSGKINLGIKNIELNQVFPETFDAVPEGQLREVGRLAKLTGVKMSFHAPIVNVEPSGVTQQGFSESNRESVERQMFNAVERGQALEPDGGMPITFHASSILPSTVQAKGEEHPADILFINKQNGSINKLPIEKSNFPGEEKASIKNAITNINQEQWEEALRDVSYYSGIGGETLQQSGFMKIMGDVAKKQGEELSSEEIVSHQQFARGATFINNAYRKLKNLYDMAYQNASDEDQKRLEKLHKQIEEKALLIKKNPGDAKNAVIQKQIIDDSIDALQSLKAAPEVFMPLNDFAQDRATKTFANVAYASYKKFGDKSPIISIENTYPGAAFSTGSELKAIVEESREKFVDNAMEDGMSKGDAKKKAEAIIGATWDVGRINIMRKYGYDSKDIAKETQIIAPLVKHVHLSDNFGFEQTELPMGMGNVPIKKIMEKLGDEGYKGVNVIEALQWWQHFSPQGSPPNSPIKPTLEAFGSPIYSMQMAPYWNQTGGLSQDYPSGLGMVFPQGHFETFGAGGFSQLPMEVGGTKPGQDGSGTSGKPME